MDYQIRINIAEIVFQISSPNQRPISWLKENYKPFLSNKNPNFQVLFNFERKRKGTELFDVDINFAEKNALVFVDYDFGIVDILKFLCAVILAKQDGFLLHASAILHKGFSYVFFGPSQSGKTTLARLSKDKVVLTDETTAIVKNNGIYYAYATPFFGEFGQVEQNTGAPVKAVFFLNKGTQFKHCLVKPVDMVKEMLYNTMINISDAKTGDHLLNILDVFVRQTPCYSLYFKPEPMVWEYIDGFIR